MYQRILCGLMGLLVGLFCRTKSPRWVYSLGGGQRKDFIWLSVRLAEHCCNSQFCFFSRFPASAMCIILESCRRVNKLQLRIPDVMTTVKDCDFTRAQVDFILHFAECVFGSGYITHSFVFPIPPPHLHKCSWMFIYESMNGSLIAEMNKVRNLFQVCV